MVALALENLLQDFGKRARAGDHDLDTAALVEIVASRSEPAISRHMLDAEIARAQAEAEQRLAAEHEAVLAAERQRHATELAALNAQLGGEAGLMIAERLRQMEDAISGLATSAAARILAVHLTADVRKRMIDSLGQAIRDAIRDSEAVRIRIRGPLSLYESLAASLGALSRHLDFTEAPGLDLFASIDDSLFETRLADWSAALAEALS